MTLEKIKKVDWRYVINRREALLFKSITDNSYSFFNKYAGIKWKVNFILRTSDGPLLHSGQELDNIKNIFIEGGVKLLNNFSRRLVVNVKSFGDFAKSLESKDFSVLSQKEISYLISKFARLAFAAHNFLVPMPMADKAISQMMLSRLPDAKENKKADWLSTLSYPKKMNTTEFELISFYKLAMAYGKKSSSPRAAAVFKNMLNAHVKTYGYMGARNYWWEQAWTEDDIISRLKNFCKENKNPRDELKKIGKTQSERESAFNKLTKKLHLGKKSGLFKLINIARKYAFLRTWRTDIIYGSGYRARNLFYEIARRAKADKIVIPFLTIWEVIKMARLKKCPISAEEFKKRKQFNASLRMKNNFYVLSGLVWKKKLAFLSGPAEELPLKDFKGNIAYPGIARGRVVVVKQGTECAESLNKVKRGDIMVATMTFPNFIPAMEKAAAFITDEGGILCHAAIVAREMKKPCIIGTKIATRVLKDGDRVEVDAIKGIVKILSRH